MDWGDILIPKKKVCLIQTTPGIYVSWRGSCTDPPLSRSSADAVTKHPEQTTAPLLANCNNTGLEAVYHNLPLLYRHTQYTVFTLVAPPVGTMSGLARCSAVPSPRGLHLFIVPYCSLCLSSDFKALNNYSLDALFASALNNP